MILNSRCLGVSVSLDSGKLWWVGWLVGWFRFGSGSQRQTWGPKPAAKHLNLSRCESQNLIVVFVCNVPNLDCAHLVVTPPSILRFPPTQKKNARSLLPKRACCNFHASAGKILVNLPSLKLTNGLGKVLNAWHNFQGVLPPSHKYRV